MTAQIRFKKMTKIILLSAFIVSIFTSCSGETGPKEVLKAWLTHRSKGECKQAFDLEVDSYHRIFDEYQCEAFHMEIKAINCEIEGEAAICDCYVSVNKKETEQYFYDLKKVDGRWKVSANN